MREEERGDAEEGGDRMHRVRRWLEEEDEERGVDKVKRKCKVV